MKSPRSLALWLICFSLGGLAVTAQSTPALNPAAPAQKPAVSDLKPLTDALQLRSEMAAGVASGNEDSDAAVVRLRMQDSPSGLKIDPTADFAYAAIDLGQRLIVTNKSAAAERFFQEAEKSLSEMIQKTPDKSAREKAQYLGVRANIRARYLGEATAAKADIDAALQLQPDDAELKQLRMILASERAVIFSDAAKG